MSNLIEELKKKKLINTADWLPNSVQYLCVMGSIAYGVAKDSSDYDVYGFCIPKKEMCFPWLAGEIPGFGKQIKRFEQFQQHGIVDHPNNVPQDLSYDDICKELKRRNVI